MSEVLRPSRAIREQITGELLMDMFYTMTLNMRANKAFDNRLFLERLLTIADAEGPNFGKSIRVKVVAMRTGSLIMRRGAMPYLDRIENGLPTVTGVITSIDLDAVSFCVYPGEGKTVVTQEVCAIPYDYQTLEQRVNIEVLSVGPTSDTPVPETEQTGAAGPSHS